MGKSEIRYRLIFPKKSPVILSWIHSLVVTKGGSYWYDRSESFESGYGAAFTPPTNKLELTMIAPKEENVTRVEAESQQPSRSIYVSSIACEWRD